MKNIKLFAFALIIATSCGDQERDKKDALLEKYNCSSLDDCLWKYEFEGARAYLSLKKESGYVHREGAEINKILDAEANYWVKEKEYKKALSVIDESADDYSGDNKREKRFKLLSLIIDELIEDGDFTQAKLYALKGSDEHTIEGWSDVRDEEKTQQKILLKKVEKAEKLLSK